MVPCFDVRVWYRNGIRCTDGGCLDSWREKPYEGNDVPGLQRQQVLIAPSKTWSTHPRTATAQNKMRHPFQNTAHHWVAATLEMMTPGSQLTITNSSDIRPDGAGAVRGPA